MRNMATKLALATGLLCVASFAQAQTTFKIVGTITAGTCTVAVNGGANVNVGTFPSNLFTGSFQSGFIPNFYLNYSNCGAGIKSLTFTLTGTADKTVGGNTAYWDSTLNGAPFELKDVTRAVNLPPSGAAPIVISNPGTSGTYPLTAQFHQTGALAAIGTGSATVAVNTTYL